MPVSASPGAWWCKMLDATTAMADRLLPQHCFEREIDRLWGHICKLEGEHSADIYVRTTKCVVSYMAQSCQHGGDICQAVELWARPMSPMPRAHNSCSTWDGRSHCQSNHLQVGQGIH